MFDTDGALLTKIRQMETEIRQRHHNCAYLRLDKEFSKAYANHFCVACGVSPLCDFGKEMRNVDNFDGVRRIAQIILKQKRKKIINMLSLYRFNIYQLSCNLRKFF
jgi:hypothetical protein